MNYQIRKSDRIELEFLRVPHFNVLGVCGRALTVVKIRASNRKVLMGGNDQYGFSYHEYELFVAVQ